MMQSHVYKLLTHKLKILSNSQFVYIILVYAMNRKVIIKKLNLTLKNAWLIIQVTSELVYTMQNCFSLIKNINVQKNISDTQL